MTWDRRPLLCSWYRNVTKFSKKLSFPCGSNHMRSSQLDLTAASLKLSLMHFPSVRSKRRQTAPMQRLWITLGASMETPNPRSTSALSKTLWARSARTAWCATSCKSKTDIMRTSWSILRGMCSILTSDSCSQMRLEKELSSKRPPLSWLKKCLMSWVGSTRSCSQNSAHEWPVASAPCRLTLRKSLSS